MFSHYIAEVANTFSNLVTVALAVYGAVQSAKEDLPRRYLAGWVVSDLLRRIMAGL